MRTLVSLFLSLFLVVSVAFAQDTTSVKKKGLLTGKGFRIYTNVNLCSWLDQPDSIKSKLFKSRGADVYLRYSARFGKSRFGFAPAIGVSSYDISSNGQLSSPNDTTYFTKVLGSYRKNKFSANYGEIPLELFYESNEKNPLRISIGFKAGYLLSSHQKYKTGSLKMKSYDVPNLMKYRYGVTLQMIYGWFGVNAFYSMTPLFEKNLGPAFTPISFGITIAPY